MFKLYHCCLSILFFASVPLYGMSDSLSNDVFDSTERVIYEEFKNIVEERINQGLKGDDLIKPYRENDSCNLLERLIYRDYSDLVERLVNYDPLIKKRDEFHKALEACVYKNNLELTKWFIAHGANVNFNQGRALKTASRDDVPAIVALLLIHNANPNLQSGFGETVLHEVVAFDALSLSYEKFSTSQDWYHMAQLLIVGGTDITIRMYYTNGSYEGKKTAAGIARIKQKFELADFIKKTAKQRDDLFAAVVRGEDVTFANVNGISRRHVRDIHGNNLLYYAILYNNIPVRQKLVKLWPQLFAQPNFEGRTVINLLPRRSIELLDHK